AGECFEVVLVAFEKPIQPFLHDPVVAEDPETEAALGAPEQTAEVAASGVEEALRATKHGSPASARHRSPVRRKARCGFPRRATDGPPPTTLLPSRRAPSRHPCCRRGERRRPDAPRNGASADGPSGARRSR